MRKKNHEGRAFGGCTRERNIAAPFADARIGARQVRTGPRIRIAREKRLEDTRLSARLPAAAVVANRYLGVSAGFQRGLPRELSQQTGLASDRNTSAIAGETSL